MFYNVIDGEKLHKILEDHIEACEEILRGLTTKTLQNYWIGRRSAYESVNAMLETVETLHIK